jgi:hypothetical protein
MQHVWREEILMGDPRGKNHLGKPGHVRRIILKLILWRLVQGGME